MPSKKPSDAAGKKAALPAEPPLTIERLMRAWSCSKEEAQWLLDQAGKAKDSPIPQKAASEEAEAE